MRWSAWSWSAWCWSCGRWGSWWHTACPRRWRSWWSWTSKTRQSYKERRPCQINLSGNEIPSILFFPDCAFRILLVSFCPDSDWQSSLTRKSIRTCPSVGYYKSMFSSLDKSKWLFFTHHFIKRMFSEVIDWGLPEMNECVKVSYLQKTITRHVISSASQDTVTFQAISKGSWRTMTKRSATARCIRSNIILFLVLDSFCLILDIREYKDIPLRVNPKTNIKLYTVMAII